MAGFSERLYYRLPAPLQNAAVSLKGAGLFRERYGRAGRAQAALLAESATWDAGRIAAFQDTCVRGMVAHAVRHVPFYRALAERDPSLARDFRGTADLPRLPLLEKSRLRETPADFLAAPGSFPGGVLTLGTSGTSGTPLRLTCDVAGRQKHYAFWSRLRRSSGVGDGAWRATFFGRILFDPARDRPPYWRYDLAQRNLLFSSYHLGPAHLPAVCDKLRRAACPEIIGYPSSLFLVAEHLVAAGQAPLRPRVVFTTAETLLARQRERLQQAFDCPIIDQYGCTEMVLFVAQCAHGSYHVHPEHGYLEILLPDGSPAPPGTPGEAVCTGFLNLAMPLLRYRLGDRVVAAAGGGACACGSSFPRLASIEGRSDDILYTPDGRPLPRLDPIFKTLSGIRETQIVQEDLLSLTLIMATDPQFGEAEERELLAEIRKRTGPAMEIRLQRVASIPKGANGKFKSVVSRVPRRPGDS